MPDATETLRKAAILIDSLDARTADDLLDQMGPQQAAKVRSAVLELDDVTQAERERVIAEFLGRDEGDLQDDDHPGVELDASLASKFGAPEPASAIAPRLPEVNSTGLAGPRPFDFLHEATPDSLAAFLHREHPQTAALVLAHLAPEHSARVLKALAAPFQVEVVRRMIDLEETAPEVLRDVERQIEALLSHELRAKRRRHEGMATVGAILAAAGGTGREAILANLSSADKGLAQRLDDVTEQTAVVSTAARWRRQLQQAEPAKQPRAAQFTPVAAARQASPASRAVPLALTPTPPARSEIKQPIATPTKRGQDDAPEIQLEFDDLLELDDRSLAAVIAAAQAELALLALTGAPQRLVDRVLKQLPRGEAKALRKRIAQTGPLRLRDIQRAQEQLARIATRLAANGEIRIPSMRRFAVAA